MKFLQRLRLGAPRSFTLINAAFREAQLADRGTVTGDDLLIALLASGGPASRLLAAHGASLDAVRAAAAGRDADDLGSLGIAADAVPPRPRIPLGALYGAVRRPDTDPEVDQLLERHAAGGELALLRGLLDQPSGAATEALRRAGVDVAAVRAGLDAASTDEAEAALRTRQAAPIPGLLDGLPSQTVTATRFVPVPTDVLARVVRTPELVARWYPLGPDVTVGDDGVLHTRQGPGERARPVETRLVVDRSGADATEVAWQSFLPIPGQDARSAYLHVRLTPAPGGTDLVLSRGFRGYGRLGFAFRRIAASLSRLSLGQLIQNLAEVGTEEARRQA